MIVQLETPLRVVARAIEFACEANVLVVLNPAPASDLPSGLLRKVDLLVPNETEASILTGLSVGDVESARKAACLLQSKGVNTVTITLGSAGSVTATGEDIIHTPAFPVDVADVTAAGDSFCACLAYALTESYDLETALRFASAGGALSVTRLGAQPSLPTLDEINTFLEHPGG